MDYTYNESPYFKLIPKDFPTREQQLVFINAYLDHMPEHIAFPHGEGRDAEIENILLEVMR